MFNQFKARSPNSLINSKNVQRNGKIINLVFEVNIFK